MCWNFRVVKRVNEDDEKEFGVHEAFYASPSDEEPEAISTSPVRIVAESPEALREVLEKMLAALDKPVLDEDEFNA